MTAQPVSVTAGIVPTRDVRVEGRNEDGTFGPMLESADISNRTYIASLEGEARGAYRFVEHEDGRAAIGTTFLDPFTGYVYRLTGWQTRGYGEHRTATTPSYSVLLPEGAQTRAYELPVAAIAIWSPAPVA